jgi:hypothetical protein
MGTNFDEESWIVPMRCALLPVIQALIAAILPVHASGLSARE